MSSLSSHSAPALAAEPVGIRRLTAARTAAPAPVIPAVPGVRMAGVTLHALTPDRAAELVMASLARLRGGVLLTVNLDQLHLARTDVVHHANVDEADLVLPSGRPLLWASRLRGLTLPAAAAGGGLTHAIAREAVQHGRSVFLLGGTRGAARLTAEKLLNEWPYLRIAGTHELGTHATDDPSRLARAVDALREGKPDVVLIAAPSPEQERLIKQLRSDLPFAWWIGVGDGLAEFIGDVPVAPRLAGAIGMGWLWRLAGDPRGLFRRYVTVGLPFAGWLWAGSAVRGVQHLVRGSPVFTDLPQGRWANGTQWADRPLDVAARLAGGVNQEAVERAGSNEASTRPAPAARHSPAKGPVRRRDEAEDAQAESSEPTVDAAQLRDVLAGLRGLVLLGGRTRSSPFRTAIDRPLLELPVLRDGGDRPEARTGGPVERLIDLWLRWGQAAADTGGLEWLPTRVIVNDESDAPAPIAPEGVVRRPEGAFTVGRDRSDHRGTGGLLHDLAADYDDDDLLLVASAHQVLLEPLDVLAAALARRFARGADVAIVSHDDGTPAGLMLVRCRALRGINGVGYIDMKEQALPAIAKQHDVRVVRTRRPTGLPVRNAAQYVAALAALHRVRKDSRDRRGAAAPPAGAFGEGIDDRFVLVERGASVDESAFLHDAVVLAGGRVEAESATVRSVVVPGGTVKRGGRAVDTVVGSTLAG